MPVPQGPNQASTNRISSSAIRAQLADVLKRIRRTGDSFIITHYGEPVAVIGPPETSQGERPWPSSGKT